MTNLNAADQSIFKKILSVFLIACIPFLYGYFMFVTYNYQITHTNLPAQEILNNADHHASGLEDHDGIERNVLLYMFLIIGPAGFLLYKMDIAPKFLMAAGAILWLAFLISMHFFGDLFTNLFSFHKLEVWFCILVVFTIPVMLWQWLYADGFFLSRFLARLLIAETIIACCMVPFGDISIYDYSYVLAPALKILQTGKISSAYFQYDILPSIPAYFILKWGGSAYTYRVVAQLSMVAFFACSFLVARRFFVFKNLAFPLLALLLIVRLFMGLNEITNVPQVTAIRLDWWLLLFAVAYYRGLADYWVGLCLALLVILLNSFGIIYLLCYLLLIGFLLVFELYNNYVNEGRTPNWEAFAGWLKTYGTNMALALGGVILHWLLTGNVVNESVSIYKDFQLGMLPVLLDSLYWYFGGVFAFCFTLLLVFKNQVSQRYFDAGLLLLFLFTGNSIYFYGRSHENNIINVSGSLLFVVVMCSDILLQLLSKDQALSTKRKAVGLAPFAFIFLTLLMANANVFAFNGNLYTKYVKDKFPSYQQEFPQALDLAIIGDITHHSKKVFFMIYGGGDFYLYYRGNYDVPSKYLPIDTWMLQKEKIDYVNQLLAQGYYIVTVNGDDIVKKEFLPQLKYKNTYTQNVYSAYSNE